MYSCESQLSSFRVDEEEEEDDDEDDGDDGDDDDDDNDEISEDTPHVSTPRAIISASCSTPPTIPSTNPFFSTVIVAFLFKCFHLEYAVPTTTLVTIVLRQSIRPLALSIAASNPKIVSVNPPVFSPSFIPPLTAPWRHTQFFRL